MREQAHYLTRALEETDSRMYLRMRGPKSQNGSPKGEGGVALDSSSLSVPLCA